MNIPPDLMWSVASPIGLSLPVDADGVAIAVETKSALNQNLGGLAGSVYLQQKRSRVSGGACAVDNN